jgi:hypothetical protein
MTESRRYRVYLLRLWQAEDEDGHPVWRASLESAQTGERCGFADLGSLFAFLEQQTTSNSEHGSRPPAAEA